MILALAAVEMWERYSFFTLLGLLVLYLSAPAADGGLGWSGADSLRLFGLYSGCVYLSPAIGGWIADRWGGPERWVTAGSWLMLAGHLLMAAPMVLPGAGLDEPSLYGALALLVCGNGLFKPNVTALVPRLYAADDPARQRGFTLFWVSMNAGSLLAALASGPIATIAGYHVAFASAGAGMAIALILFLNLRPYLPLPTAPEPARSETGEPGGKTAGGSPRAWLALLGVFLFVFFTCFAQKGGLLTIVVRDLVDRDISGFTVPVTWITGLNPALVILLGTTTLQWRGRGSPGAAAIYPIVGALAAATVAFAILLIGLRFGAGGDPLPLWMPLAVVAFLTIGELLIWPSGYATATRFAPPGRTSLYIGLLLLVYAAGFYAAGFAGALAMTQDRAHVVAMLVAATALTMIVAAVLAPLIRRRLDQKAAAPLSQ